tara:strand:- start:726 stop:2921 length:2196 start_codon:yes stop_codon:yes gene_type:complete
MKNIIIKILFAIFLLILTAITFLTTIGVETQRFNKQIIEAIEKFNEDIEINLRAIKIILDPFKFQLDTKTIGAEFKIKSKTIEIENIKTKISIISLINNEFSVKNLDISTKSLKIKNLVSFLRNYRNTPELYFLEKVLKKGYIISNISLDFDNQGNIKKNYKLSGLIKDTEIDILKKYNLKKLNSSFNFENKNLEIEDVSLFLNNIPIKSEKISIKKTDKNNLFVKGSLENNDTLIEESLVKEIINNFFSNFKIQSINLGSKNDFSFNLTDRFKIDNIKLNSKINIKNIKLKNNLNLKSFFPKIQDNIELQDHILEVNLDKKKINIKGYGDILFQEKKDSFEYQIKKENDFYNFETILDLENNPLIINFLTYKKKANNKAKLSIIGSYSSKKKTVINLFSYNQSQNNFKIKGLHLNKNLQITDINKIDLNYVDDDGKKNQINIIGKNNNFVLSGANFNAKNLIDNLIEDEGQKKIKIFKNNFNLNVNINRVYLDRYHMVKNFNGKLNFNNNEITKAKFNALFPNGSKLNFTVNMIQNEKVTTLFLGKAEPIIKRFNFIKGYNGGSLDFYSSKKGNKTVSNLKLYNFKLQKLPALTKLLTLASLQGIADILSGDGITFDEFEMNFTTSNNLITLKEIYAIGPAISILMDGYIEKSKLVSLRGSLVPATTINKVIGSIPVLGKILVGKKSGEGVFGVSFKIKGPPKNLDTTVNPIKTLTPRFITRTLEKIKKN